ncbi:MAG TPA: hypothetical protein VFP12_07570 [Allosphingosinicella sp.]|nr:hypothetical protein [Allosphingosinicella sp.]
MTSEAILAVLKFSGPVVGLASALWSMTQKITYEAADGVKRLTLQGRVLIGITVAATLISLLSLGFETVIGRQEARRVADEKRQAADAKRQDARLASEKEARAEAMAATRDQAAAARDQAAALARLEADSAEQKRFLEQRFLIAAAAAEQQRRAAQISMQIARESNRRLTEAERTLAEFERINYPLRSVEAGVELALDFDGVDMADFWKRLGERTDLRSRPRTRGLPDRVVTFEPSDISGNDYIAYGTTGTQITLKFVAPDAFEAPAGKSANEIRLIEGPVPGGGVITVRFKVRSIDADLRDRRMTAEYIAEFEPEEEGVISGEKLSLSDVNRLVPILTITRSVTNPSGRRRPDTLLRVSYRLNGIERFYASADFAIADHAAFVLYPQPPRQ